MENTDLAVIILAAGNSTRMQSKTSKVLHKIAGLELIHHVLNAANTLQPNKTIVVLGPKNEDVGDSLPDNVQVVIQDPPQGTGDAVRVAFDAHLTDFTGTVLVLYGDVPLIRTETLQSLIRHRLSITEPALAVIGFETMQPAHYGRIIAKAGDPDEIERIVEFKDATEEERQITLCNSGIMAFNGARMGELLGMLQNDNESKEYYLTDCVEHARSKGWTARLKVTDESDVMGINTRHELAIAEQIVQNRLRQRALEAGVTLKDPNTVFLCQDTALAADVTVEPNVVFGPGVSVATGATLRAFSHLEDCTIQEDAVVGPYARIRPGTTVGSGACVGNFVEVKNTNVGENAKINHLSYVGDATVGAEANIGAGTITCNYDGFQKSQTEIGIGAFIGSNSALVAPVTIGDGAIIGAGSTVTKDVADNALAVTRPEQKQIDGGAEKFRKKQSQKQGQKQNQQDKGAA